MGQALTVTLPSTVSKGSKTSLKVYYDTTESGLAVQWLEKEYVKNDRLSSTPEIFIRQLERCTDKHKEIPFRTCSVSASRYMPDPWLRYKVSGYLIPLRNGREISLTLSNIMMNRYTVTQDRMSSSCVHYVRILTY